MNIISRYLESMKNYYSHEFITRSGGFTMVKKSSIIKDSVRLFINGILLSPNDYKIDEYTITTRSRIEKNSLIKLEYRLK
jgi:hypothetical protein